MLSKIRSFQPLLQNTKKRLFSKKYQPGSTNKASSSVKEDFIDINKFKEDYLLLYQSQETTSSRVISVVLASLGLINAYQYYQGEEKFSHSNEGLTALTILSFLTLYELKLHKTPKSIFLYKDGKTVYLEIFRFLGFGARTIELEVGNFKGYGPYIKKYSKIPIAKYEEGKKRRFIFFKTMYIAENEILRKVFSGYSFKVGTPETNIHLSKKYKSRFDV